MYEIFEKFEENLEIERFYNEQRNYKVESIGDEGYCYIFFTSHGLYYPTSIEEFRKNVITSDKYEWMNIASDKEIKNKASIYVFVRDIYKNWCINGCNGIINTQDKVAELLKNLSRGKRIITVGSSAGGYMAILFGCLLKAEAIYAFSPQISLDIYNQYHPIKYYEQYRGNLKYLDLLGGGLLNLIVVSFIFFMRMNVMKILLNITTLNI